jgi:hypothetical protein
MRRACVERVKFPDIWQQEDYQWSKVIHERKLLRKEFFIDKDMYWYQYVTKVVPKRHRVR